MATSTFTIKALDDDVHSQHLVIGVFRPKDSIKDSGRDFLIAESDSVLARS
jgi:hypothetical protein